MRLLTKIYSSIMSGALVTSVVMGILLVGECWGVSSLFFAFLTMIVMTSYAAMYTKKSQKSEIILHLLASISHIIIWVMYFDFTSLKFGGTPGDLLYSTNHNVIHFVNLYLYIGIAVSAPIVFFKEGKIEIFLSLQMKSVWKLWLMGILSLMLFFASLYAFHSYLFTDPMDFG